VPACCGAGRAERERVGTSTRGRRAVAARLADESRAARHAGWAGKEAQGSVETRTRGPRSGGAGACCNCCDSCCSHKPLRFGGRRRPGRVRRRCLGRDTAPSDRGAAVMLSLPPAVRVFVAVAPLDMRGSFDAIAGAVRRIGLDPVNGHLYLFSTSAGGLPKRCGSMARAGACSPSAWRPAAFSCRRSMVTSRRLRSTGRRSPRSWPASTSPPRGAAGTDALASKSRQDDRHGSSDVICTRL
jgi:hypothetical protein